MCCYFRVRRIAGYLTMEDELLCDAWLFVSVDFVGRSRRGLFWQRVHDPFHARKHIVPYDMHIIHFFHDRKCETVIVSMVRHPDQRHLVFVAWLICWRQGGHCARQGRRS